MRVTIIMSAMNGIASSVDTQLVIGIATFVQVMGTAFCPSLLFRFQQISKKLLCSGMGEF